MSKPCGKDHSIPMTDERAVEICQQLETLGICPTEIVQLGDLIKMAAIQMDPVLAMLASLTEPPRSIKRRMH
jgi:hypothetical protein